MCGAVQVGAQSIILGAQNIILQIQNIPTTYDKINGKLQNFETFKWMFEIKKETVNKSDKIEYSYQESPVYKELCSACGGSGQVTEQAKCSTCNGNGKLQYNKYNLSGQVVSTYIGNCNVCGGSGLQSFKVKCTKCSGNGKIEYPKSPMPQVSKKVDWTGWVVTVNTVPQ